MRFFIKSMFFISGISIIGLMLWFGMPNIQSAFKPIEREGKSESKIDEQEEKGDLVDLFIAKNPKIKPVKNESYNPIVSRNEPTDYNTLMTETLAKVYLEQKKYKNAIKAYRILSLKYPEKSSIFANRIKAIKLLDKN